MLLNFDSTLSWEVHDLRTAIKCTEDSIDTAELAEHRNFLTEVLIEQIKLYIETDQLEKAGKLVSKMETQLKKMADTSHKPIVSAMKFFIDSKNNNVEPELVNSFRNTMEGSDILGNEFVFWYLARTYQNIERYDTAKSLQG